MLARALAVLAVVLFLVALILAVSSSGEGRTVTELGLAGLASLAGAHAFGGIA